MDRERGQALPLLALLIVLAGCMVLLLGRFGGLAAGRAQARTAADAAALAGAAEGRDAAARFAARNGARVVDYRTDGDDTQVKVLVGDALVEVARARRFGWPDGVVGNKRGLGGLAPGMQAAVARAEQLLGRSIPIVSGYRSPEEQKALWRRRGSNPYPVAPPGTSMHERGLAIDVPKSFVAVLLHVASRAGLCHPVPADPIHFELCRWSPSG